MGKFVSLFNKKYLIFIGLLIIALFLLTNSTFAEDIILTGNQVMVIENTTYTQTGNIFVRESAKLIIKNSTLIFNQRYHEEFRIAVQDNGTFEVIETTIETGILQNELVEIIAQNKANIIFERANWRAGYLELGGSSAYPGFMGTSSISNSQLGQLWIMFSSLGGSNILLENSYLNCLTFRFGSYYQGDFSDLKPGLHSYWEYKKENYDIIIKNTTFRTIDLHLDEPAQITIRNSEFAALGCGGNSSMTLEIINTNINIFA